MTARKSLLPSAAWPPTEPPADGSLGRATISPAEPVVAGEFGTWTVTYTAGRWGVDDGGALRLAFHQTSDAGGPQFDDPAAPNYCTVNCSSPAPTRLAPRFDRALGVRPWKRTLALRVHDQAIRPGDTVTVTLGDRSGGSPGVRGQTYAGPLQLHVLVDVAGTGVFLPVGESLAVPVVAGPPDHLRIHAPSNVTAGEPFLFTVVTLDRWGNVISHCRQQTTLPSPGVHVIPISDDTTGLRGESNPVRCHAAAALPERRVFWGDFHAQSEETVGSGTLDEYFTHARDHAAVDFVGHQGNDFQVTRPVWEAIMAKTMEYDAQNDFITFAGYEWSGNTPGGGDHNVHFKGGPGQRYDLHRSGHWLIHDRSDADTDRFPVTELYREFAGRKDVILIPHVGGRYANLTEYFDESLMPLVEISSCWGVFEWFAGDAFARGAVFGLSAGSDDHTARPGMSHAPRGHFAIGGGLTAVLAKEKSREALWEAIKARRTYATTGARMLLDVTAQAGASTATMGAVMSLAPGQPLRLDVSVHGTAPLWRAEVLRWTEIEPEVVYRHPFTPPPSPQNRHRIRLGWAGCRIRARDRMTTWDGSLRLESGDARFVTATGWGFDQPEAGISHQTEHEVKWESETAGDWDGIVVELDGPATTPLTFTSGPVTFQFTTQDLARGPLVKDAGGVEQRVELELDPGPQQPRALSFTHEPSAGSPGQSAYVVRVTQQDGHIAWSSPIFVRR